MMYSHPLVVDLASNIPATKEAPLATPKLKSEYNSSWLRVRDNIDHILYYIGKFQRLPPASRPDSIKCYVALMELTLALQQALQPNNIVSASFKDEELRREPPPIVQSPHRISEAQQTSQPTKSDRSTAEMSVSDSETETDSGEFMSLPSISSFDSALSHASRSQYPWAQHANAHNPHIHQANQMQGIHHPLMTPMQPIQNYINSGSRPINKNEESLKIESDSNNRFHQHNFVYHNHMESHTQKVPRRTPSPIKAPPQVPFLSPKPVALPTSSLKQPPPKTPLAQELAMKKRRRVRNTSGLGLVCEECSATETPEWRRGPNGSKTLCNACGLQYAKKIKREMKEKEVREQMERNSLSYTAPVRVTTDVTLAAPNVVGRFDSLPLHMHDLSSPSLSRQFGFAGSSIMHHSTMKEFKPSQPYTFHSHSCV